MVPSPLDPGQLVALDALLSEGSVTRAAGRLGISQSSMSHRLAQLRRALGDPLFVRQGSALLPTPRAVAIAGPLGEALRALAASVAPATPFEPRTQAFTIGIAMPDLLVPLAPRLVEALVADAPRIDIRLTTIVPSLSAALAAEPASLALTPARFVDDEIRSRALGELRFGVAARRNHPALRGKLSTERWLGHPHVVVRIGNERTNVVEAELARRGLVRRVGLEVPSFLAALLVVARSDFLVNVPMPIALDAAKALGLRLREPPIPLPPIRFALAWHARYHHDPAHQWARERVLAAVRPLFAR